MILANIFRCRKSLLRHPLVVASLVIVATLFLTTTPVGATCNMSDISDLTIQTGASCAQGTGQPSQLVGDGGVFNRITSILLFIVGAVAVIMLIVGGIRYVISGGDQTQVTAAKNTILYAIIGIVVAILAYALVRFVTTSLLSGIG